MGKYLKPNRMRYGVITCSNKAQLEVEEKRKRLREANQRVIDIRRLRSVLNFSLRLKSPDIYVSVGRRW